MKQRVNLLESVLYALSHTDIAVVQRCSNDAKTSRYSIGSILFFCTFFAFASAFYFIYIASSGSIIGATTGGFIYGGIVLTLSQMIFKSKSYTALAVRAIIIVIFSIFTAMPIKLMCLHTTLADTIQRETHAYNQGLYKKIVGSVEQTYHTRIHILGNQIVDAMEERQSLEVVNDLKRRRKEAESQKKTAIVEAKQAYQLQKKQVITDFLQLYTTYWRLLTNRDTATNMAIFAFSWVAFMVILIVELSPIIVFLILPKTDYDRQIEFGGILMAELIDLRTQISHAEMLQTIGDTESKNQFTAKTPQELAIMKARFNQILKELQSNYTFNNKSFQAYNNNHQPNEASFESEYQ